MGIWGVEVLAVGRWSTHAEFSCIVVCESHGLDAVMKACCGLAFPLEYLHRVVFYDEYFSLCNSQIL